MGNGEGAIVAYEAEGGGGGSSGVKAEAGPVRQWLTTPLHAHTSVLPILGNPQTKGIILIFFCFGRMMYM